MSSTPHPTIKFVLDGAELDALAEAAQRGLTAHNNQAGFKGKIDRGRFGYSIVPEGGGAAQAGVCCALKGDWIHIDYLWVDYPHRERGLGRILLQKVEDEAIKRGCVGLHLTTISFQAPDFYEKCGFSILAELQDFPQKGYSRLYMVKRLPIRDKAEKDAAAEHHDKLMDERAARINSKESQNEPQNEPRNEPSSSPCSMPPITGE